MAHDTEGNINSLKEATLALIEAQQQENDEMTKKVNTLRNHGKRFLSSRLLLVYLFQVLRGIYLLKDSM
jgi:hypothetical protein